MELIREINDNWQITNYHDTCKYLDEFKNEDREFFIVLGLDSQNKVLYRDITSIGTLNSSLVHPREVFKTACMRSANSIIIAHNHPSGSLEPSQNDIDVFKRLKKAGEILDIKIVDTLIISKDGLKSFKDT